MSAALSMPPHSLSIVVPFYNEEDNIAPLVKRVHEALVGYENPWELVLVDDGSSDATVDRALASAKEYGPHVRIVELTRNFKQTAAMQAGIDAARGDVIVTMDGDLQNDPVDIPRMVARLLNENLDLVAGWRQNRQDGLFLRKIPSKIANKLIARMTGVHLRDYPGHFFGGSGLGLTAISGLIMTWLAWVKFGLGENIGGRPLLIVAIGGLIAGVHFITTGVLAELLARIYFESGTIRSYSARPESPLGADEGWHKAA